MIDPAIAAAAESVRARFHLALAGLDGVASFRALASGSERLRHEWAACQNVAASPRVHRPFAAAFSCAFVGSSGDGKTSILAEMFPDLDRRGWLNTDVTDTTSQALIIRRAEGDPPDVRPVVVRSWSLEQIRRLVQAADAENARADVVVRSYPDHVEIDGSRAQFEARDRDKFKFPLKQQLRPLPRDYELTPEQSADPGFIRTLTVKEPSERVRRGPALTLDGQAFEPLALRAAIKEVELREPFSEILRWAGAEADRAAEIVFIDTPGLRVSGSIKDEVLLHVLGKKNQQIIVELLRHDELDLIVHLVLCPNQSAFAELWKAVSEQCSPEELADLGDRLILAINGTNRYLTNDDLKRKWTDPSAVEREGDHFAVTLEDNVLKKMSERGTVRPARVCFLDSRRIVTSSHGDYATFYRSNRLMLDFWGTPQAPCYRTLERLGLVESYQQNVEALCDPDDRGQGFLVRQILAVLRANGPRLFLRKNLIRTRLLSSARQLREGLSRSYDADGRLNYEAIQQAIRRCLRPIDPHDLFSIERFASLHLDARVEQLVPAPGAAGLGERWVRSAFQRVVQELYDQLMTTSKPAQQDRALFAKIYQEKANGWQKSWGYATARMPAPTRQEPAPSDLLRQSLKLHVREMLYQLVSDGSSVAAGQIAQSAQSAGDQEAVRQALERLDAVVRDGEALCRQHGGL